MELITFLLDRTVIISLGVAGGVIATVGSYLLRKNSNVDPTIARYVLKSGYALTWGSVGLFIVAGFASAYMATPS